MLDTAITIGQAIQISVAPVFLLTGVAAMLAVFTTRLNGILEEARRLRDDKTMADVEVAEAEKRLRRLCRRARLLHASITLATGAALFVSLVIAVIFLGFIGEISTGSTVGYLFVTGTFSFVGALLLFLAEVNLATHCIRFPPRVKRISDRESFTSEETAH